LAERCAQDVAGEFVRRVVCAEDNIERRTKRMSDANLAREAIGSYGTIRFIHHH
jgi:hypothetical protein